MSSQVFESGNQVSGDMILPYKCTKCGRLPLIFRDIVGWYVVHSCVDKTAISEGPCLSEWDVIEAWNWHFEPEVAA